ncbi:MAG: DUF721 domain-containing protein [Bacteroidales bacterium]|nr:DUF721 domain-containing protein [Bacteroidales bacterium]MDD3891857.1 DUF721 domain-containing protein [Bacteroidales bacterium]
MARKSNTLSLGEAIKEFLDQYKHKDKINEVVIISSWSAVMGPNITKLTNDVYFKNGKLIVQLKSPTLRQELSMQRSKITEALNKHLGSNSIKGVILR